MEIVELKVSDICVNPEQPRKAIRDIIGLACSMKELGQLAPISVFVLDEKQKKKCGTKYMLANGGERRLTAARHLKWDSIKAIIEEPNYFCMLAENMARDNMCILEKMDAINKAFTEKYGVDWKKLLNEVVSGNWENSKNKCMCEGLIKDCNAISISPKSILLYYPVLNLPVKTREVIFGNLEYFTDGVVRKLASLKEKDEFLTEVAGNICENKMDSSHAINYVRKAYLKKTKSDLEIFCDGFEFNFRSIRVKLNDFIDSEFVFSEGETFTLQRKFVELRSLCDKCLDRCRGK